MGCSYTLTLIEDGPERTGFPLGGCAVDGDGGQRKNFIWQCQSFLFLIDLLSRNRGEIVMSEHLSALFYLTVWGDSVIPKTLSMKVFCSKKRFFVASTAYSGPLCLIQTRLFLPTRVKSLYMKMNYHNGTTGLWKKGRKRTKHMCH